MRATILLPLALLVALAACGRRDNAEEAAQTTDAAASSEPQAPPPPTSRRKPGLWEQSASISGVDFVQTSRICIDAATDARLSWAGGQTGAGPCGPAVTARQPDGSWRFSTVCDMGSGGKVTTRGVASGDFDRHYEVQADTVTEGAALEQMNGVRKTSMVADWRGPCPDGMKGGEALLPGGLRMNLLESAAPR